MTSVLVSNPSLKLGDRVSWTGPGTGITSYKTGYITGFVDYHGFVKVLVRSNGHIYHKRPQDIELA